MANDIADLRKNPFVIVSREIFSDASSGHAPGLDPENVHHLRRVLRNTGEIVIFLSCGDGRVLPVLLTNDNLLVLKGETSQTVPRPVRTSFITPGIQRKNLEIMIKKLTELGIDSIVFISSDYQNYPAENADRYEKIVMNACEQSKNPWQPRLVNSRTDLFGYPYQPDVLYIWGDPLSEITHRDFYSTDLSLYREICFINGPEGGWSAREEEFLKNRFRSVRLSRNVLRAETAAIVATYAIKLLAEVSGQNES